MADLLALSARFIDEGVYEGPGSVNRVSGELSEVAPGIAVVESFSHVVACSTDAGLVLFDTSLEAFGPRVRDSLRSWSDDAVHALVYTHGHVDHVGGAATFLAEARERGAPRPRVLGHANVQQRFERYEATEGYNAVINLRQFGGGGRPALQIGAEDDGDGASGGTSPPGPRRLRFGPREWVRPDTTFRERLDVRVGELEIQLRHARGETDDHLWAWLPGPRAVCAGDFVIWVFPNAGNPQKVQRYPAEWARALRAMRAREPELLLPAHGLPIAGRDRIGRVLDEMASVLEHLVGETLARMNAGASLDTVLQEVAVPAELLERPYLRPVYDEPEFVIRNIWRLYGGWYDGDPAHLKPPAAAALARELAVLAGGAEVLAARGRERADAGDLRLACQLVELAVQADPECRAAHAARADVYTLRRRDELSLMAKGIFGAAAQSSREKLEGAGEETG
jgi:alkyl sulfatase BDS1-like metallo-beta-lactamase superfamily hydrolase